MQLTPEQQSALELIQRKQFILINGVTGSGKTEIYLQAAARAIERGQQVIVLVPEIALTPQTIARFSARFATIAVLHSALTPKERRENWRKISSGEVNLAIGARSVLFAPFQNLGLIIIDEEHDGSYKQDNNPRYHAVRAALKRAELCGAKVILGTATPSLETYHLFQTSDDARYGLVSLPSRVNNRPLPPVEIVDLREELKAGNFSVLSRRLQEELRACIDTGGKALLFINRRGFSTYVSCRACGLVLECPRCSVALTYHSDANARCHYCGHEQAVPPVCPHCQSNQFKYVGTGTQRVETELQKIFADVQIFRMDGDTTQKRGAHERILRDFLSGDKAVLLGTQMIAKGHDFPEVTLVGIISADTLLHLPDFHAAEQTFQLLAQAGGRAGRGDKPGKVIVQTRNPEHYAIRAAAEHDYLQFYEREIEERQKLGFPPFTKLTSIVFSSADKEIARAEAERYAAKYSALGPAPCIIPKIKNMYRWQILLKDTEVDYADFPAESAVKIEIDVDPVNMY